MLVSLKPVSPEGIKHPRCKSSIPMMNMTVERSNIGYLQDVAKTHVSDNQVDLKCSKNGNVTWII